ncbi:MAG: hypothetical protein J6K55_00790 [Clostridia bacterium]|nr:hypothetical protein [Clostridia bacterium]
MELVHENISVSDVEETAPEDILELDAELIDDFIAGKSKIRNSLIRHTDTLNNTIKPLVSSAMCKT